MSITKKEELELASRVLAKIAGKEALGRLHPSEELVRGKLLDLVERSYNGGKK